MERGSIRGNGAFGSLRALCAVGSAHPPRNLACLPHVGTNGGPVRIKTGQNADVMKSAFLLFKGTIENWSVHKDARQGAALAYYSVFSVGPLMIIAIGIAGLAFGEEAARGEVQGELSGMVGQSAAAAIDSMLANANKPQQGLLATVIGTAVLLFSALGVVI